MLKLEKLVIGAVRGSTLSQQVQLLHQEFAETYKFITEKPYDCLDLNNKVRSVGITGCTGVSLTTIKMRCKGFMKY